MHEVHWIEFVPTPFPQTPQGNFPDLSLRPSPSQHFNTFVLPKLTLSPFPSIPALHLYNFSINSSMLSANRTRSSAYSNSIFRACDFVELLFLIRLTDIWRVTSRLI